MSELLPPCVIRTAVTVGVFAAIEGGAATPARIAAVCETHPDATAKLLRHLVAMNLLTVDGDRFGLTEMGEILADPDTFASQALHFGKIHTRLDMAFLGLLEAVRTGAPAPGHGFADKAREPGFVEDFHEEAAAGAVYRAPALPTPSTSTGYARSRSTERAPASTPTPSPACGPTSTSRSSDCPRQTTGTSRTWRSPGVLGSGASTGASSRRSTTSSTWLLRWTSSTLTPIRTRGC